MNKDHDPAPDGMRQVNWPDRLVGSLSYLVGGNKGTALMLLVVAAWLIFAMTFVMFAHLVPSVTRIQWLVTALRLGVLHFTF